MSYVGLGATEEVARLNEAVKKSTEGGGREARLTAAAVAMGTGKLDELAAKFAQTDAGKIIHNSDAAVMHLGKAIEQIRTGKMDAAGIANVAQSGFAMMNNVANILNVAGAGQVAKEMMKWGGTATTCAVGAAVPVWGWLACGLSVFSNLLDYLGTETPEGWDTPRTLFAPHELSVPLIAADASRLASVLKHYYGVDSYRTLYNRLRGVENFKWLVNADEGGGYPVRPLMTAQNKVAARDNQALPGHNLRTILQLMSIGEASSTAYTVSCSTLAAVAGWRHGMEPSGRGLYKRYDFDHDVNHHAIATAAYWGRMAAAAGGDPSRLKATVKATGDVFGWPLTAFPGTTTAEIDPRPFIIVDELINFFGGVTRREIDVGGQAAVSALVNQYGIGQFNPTQHLYVKLGDQRGEPAVVGKNYSRVCWTNLTRSTGQACDLQNKIGPNVGGDVLRDVGAIRLMAAFSFLHQTYFWGDATREGRELKDPIRQIVLTNTIADELEAPVDPRGVLGNALHQAERAPTEGRRAAALSHIDTTIRSFDGSTLANSARWSPTAGYARSVMSGEWLAQKIGREQTLLLKSFAERTALTPAQFREIQQNLLKQVQQVSPGGAIARATAPIIPLRLEPRGTGTGTGAGSVILLGAAALLALKLLK